VFVFFYTGMKLNFLLFKVCISILLASCSSRSPVQSGGFIQDIEEMRVSFSSEQEIYQIEPGDSIAEIGFGTGWMTAYMMTQYDSLTIFAEDIDRESCKYLPEVVDQYLTLRKSPQTNNLQIVKGKRSRVN
jgi:tRNA G46 methylase TrmB